MINAKRPLSAFRYPGLSLVELLVALVVTSIVLAAVATLAFAMTAAGDATDQASQNQAQLRFATLRISQLIRYCKLICHTSSTDLAIWKADNNNDGKININELVYIETGPDSNYLRLCELSCPDNPPVKLSNIDSLQTNWYLSYGAAVNYNPWIPQCNNVQFAFDLPPPQTKFVGISFDLTENNQPRHYEVNAALRCWAGNLLHKNGNEIVSDDD